LIGCHEDWRKRKIVQNLIHGKAEIEIHIWILQRRQKWQDRYVKRVHLINKPPLIFRGHERRNRRQDRRNGQRAALKDFVVVPFPKKPTCENEDYQVNDMVMVILR